MIFHNGKKEWNNILQPGVLNMIQNIIHAISSTLYQEYKDQNILILADQNVQGLNSPAFIIHDLGVQMEPTSKDHFLQHFHFEILYLPVLLPESGEWSPITTCASIREDLFVLLEVIQDPITKNIYHGLNMSGEIVENILHFYVMFDRFLKRELPTTPKMLKIRRNIFLDHEN